MEKVITTGAGVIWVGRPGTWQASAAGEWPSSENGMVAWLSFWLDGAEYKALVFRRVAEWRDAVELQHDRLIAEGSQSEADMRFYILALHNLRDAAKAIRKHYRGQAAAVGQAIKVFENHVHDLDFLRNFIEHFEEYDRREGRLQAKGAVPMNRLGSVEDYIFTQGDVTLEAFGRRLSVANTTPDAIALASAVLAEERTLPDW